MDTDFYDKQITNLIEPHKLINNHHNWVVRSRDLIVKLEGCLANPCDYFKSNQKIIYSKPKVQIARIPIGLQGNWVVRQFKYEGSAAQKKDIFRKPLAFRAFMQALAMEKEGIRTPRVLAAGVEYKFFTPQKSYFIGQEVLNPQTLGKFASLNTRIPHGLANTVANDIAKMHSKGLFHGDLTINNILIDENSLPWFVDLDRGFKAMNELSWERSIEDLHKLARFYPFFNPDFRIFFLEILKIYASERGWKARSDHFIDDCLDRSSKKTKRNDKEMFALYSS